MLVSVFGADNSKTVDISVTVIYFSRDLEKFQNFLSGWENIRLYSLQIERKWR